jgi:tetraacyldisaccharide 4'-kinase
VITRSDEIEDIAPICQQLNQINPEAPIFSGRYICDEIRRAGSEERIELDRLKQHRIISVSGLANPRSFHRLLNQHGLSVIKHLDFPDHHWYTEKDARQIQQTIAAQHLDAIITTEKDEAKLLLHSALLKAPIYVMTITLEIQPKEEFESLLLNVIGWS